MKNPFSPPGNELRFSLITCHFSDWAETNLESCKIITWQLVAVYVYKGVDYMHFNSYTPIISAAGLTHPSLPVLVLQY
jgi:hypothetical protein